MLESGFLGLNPSYTTDICILDTYPVTSDTQFPY